jgi:hypothetical protein
MADEQILAVRSALAPLTLGSYKNVRLEIFEKYTIL